MKGWVVNSTLYRNHQIQVKLVNYQSTEDISHEIDSNYTWIRNIVI